MLPTRAPVLTVSVTSSPSPPRPIGSSMSTLSRSKASATGQTACLFLVRPWSYKLSFLDAARVQPCL